MMRSEYLVTKVSGTVASGGEEVGPQISYKGVPYLHTVLLHPHSYTTTRHPQQTIIIVKMGSDKSPSSEYVLRIHPIIALLQEQTDNL